MPPVICTTGALFVTISLLAACGDEAPINAPSADLEVTLRNVEPACVRTQLLDQMVSQGFTALKNSEAMLVVSRVVRVAAGGPLSLPGAPPPPEEVIKFDYTALAPRDLRIVAQAALLLYRDTGLERLTPARARASDAAAFGSKMQVAASRCR